MKKRILNTLKKRLVLIVCTCVLGVLIPMAAVSNMILRSSEQTRLDSMMKADLHQLSAMIDKEYYTLIQMSQQMSEDGIIGETVQSYFSSVEPYERIALTSDIAASINTMIFSHQNITLVAYLQPDLQDSVFSTMPVRAYPDLEDVPPRDAERFHFPPGSPSDAEQPHGKTDHFHYAEIPLTQRIPPLHLCGILP